MTIQEAYEKATEIKAKAEAEAKQIIKEAKSDAYRKHLEDFKAFQKRHGEIIDRDELDYNISKCGWQHGKTYVAKDGATFHEVTFYPASEMGLKMEYWSRDQKSVIIYL